MNRNLTKNFDLFKETWSLWKKDLNWLISSAGILAILFIGQIIIGILYVIILVPSLIGLMDPSAMELILGGIIVGMVVLYIIAIIFSVYSSLGYTYLSLDMVKTGKAHLENVFKGYKWLGTGLVSMLLMVLIVLAICIPAVLVFIGLALFGNDALMVIGVLLLYVIIIIALLPFTQIYFVIIDQGKKARESFKESMRLMKGAKLKYFGFIVMLMLVALVPYSMIFIPMFMTFYSNPIIAASTMILVFSCVFLLMPVLYSFTMAATAKFYCDLLDDDQLINDEYLTIKDENESTDDQVITIEDVNEDTLTSKDSDVSMIDENEEKNNEEE